MIINSDSPFILLPDIILLGKVDKISNRFGREKRKPVYDVNLRAMVTLASQLFIKSKRRQECSEKNNISMACWGVTPASMSWVCSSNMLFIITSNECTRKGSDEERKSTTYLFIVPIAFPNILLIVAQTLEYFLDSGLKTL